MFSYPRRSSCLSVDSSELEPLRRSRHRKLKKKSRKDMPDRHVTDIRWQVLEVFFAEAVGTALLVFFVCMGQVNFSPGESLPSLQGAIVTAVVVATIVQIFGHISKAHINPAVTIAFLVLGHVTPAMAMVYLLSEIVGALLGYGLLLSLTPPDLTASVTPGFCCTMPHPGLSDVQAVVVEFLATSFLVMVVCACVDPRNADKADSVPLKFGTTLLTLCITVGPYTGASMNPARSLAPALWTGTWNSHWIYWMGPLLSGFSTALFYKAIFLPHHRPIPDQLASESEPFTEVRVNGPKISKKIIEQSVR